MGFEKLVIEKVSKVLNKNGETYYYGYFFNGTFFLNAPETYANKVFSMLNRDYYGKVQMSFVGDEFAYDFVA